MHVLLEAKSDQFIYLSGAGTNIVLHKRIAAAIPAPVSFTAPVHAIADFLQLIPGGDLELDVQGNTLHVRSDIFDTSIRIGTADDHIVRQIDSPPTPTTSALSEFVSAVDRVRIAQSHDEHQPVLNGIYLSVDSDSITLAATDGHRAAETRLAASSTGAPVAVVVPARSLIDLRAALGVSERALEVGVSAGLNRIRFQAGADFLESGLVEGPFPDYAKVLPKGDATVVVVSRWDLLLALRACEVFARAGSNPVSVTASVGGLRLQGQSSELGQNVSDLDADVSGPDTTVAVSGQYLLDGLAVIAEESVLLEIRGPRAPMILKPTSKAAYWYAIAPRLPLLEPASAESV